MTIEGKISEAEEKLAKGDSEKASREAHLSSTCFLVGFLVEP